MMIVSCLFLERGRDLGTEKRKENRINRLFFSFFLGGGGGGFSDQEQQTGSQRCCVKIKSPHHLYDI